MKGLLASLLIVLVSSNLAAKPGIYKKFSEAYPNSPILNSQCMICHDNEDDYARNAYGQDLENNNLDFKAIESFDSDLDGFFNIDEINLGSLPGDALSIPLQPVPQPEPLPIPMI